MQNICIFGIFQPLFVVLGKGGIPGRQCGTRGEGHIWKSHCTVACGRFQNPATYCVVSNGKMQIQKLKSKIQLKKEVKRPLSGIEAGQQSSLLPCQP